MSETQQIRYKERWEVLGFTQIGTNIAKLAQVATL